MNFVELPQIVLAKKNHTIRHLIQYQSRVYRYSSVRKEKNPLFVN